jgi:hypothetical protein
MIAADPKLRFFQTQRSELFNYVVNSVLPENKKFKLVRAPVKSGKRGMVEINCLLDKNVEHIYLTALHRIADENQRKELTSYGIKVCSVNNKEKKDQCIQNIINKLNLGKKVRIHLDELDFGCGDKQLLNYIYSSYKNNSNVEFILYSATIEVAKKEFLIANNVNDFFECDPFIPPINYFGIKNYLSTGKFFQATPFIYYDNELKITEHGKKLIQKLKENTLNITNKRHIGILRLAGNFRTDGKSISQFEEMKENKIKIQEEYSIRLKFVGSNDISIIWDDESYWEELASNLPFIIVINQVSGRSTEWKCHPYLVWYHTLRTEITPTGTLIQDQERAVYYSNTDYNNDIDIEIYGDLPSAQYSAGIISFEQYDTMTKRKINSRLNTKNKKKHIKVKDPPHVFDSWEQIPEIYRSCRSKNSHVNIEYKLKEFMNINNKTYKISNWDKYSHLEGFYMTNIRSSRDNFLNGKKNPKPIWFRSDIMNELSEGINEKSKIRINLFYEDNETNPNNYKFIIREFDSSIEANCVNTSMYNK